jgi:hypothetical protein
MKKIIALAVATAFVAPVYAADVSLGGNMDFVINDTDAGTSGTSNDIELKVSASEELGNGMSASGYIHNNADAAVTLSGDFGSFTIGNDADTALLAIDDQADVGVENGGRGGANIGIVSGMNLNFVPNIGIAGVTPIIGYAAGSTAGTDVLDYGVKFDFGGVSARIASANVSDNNNNVEMVSVSYTAGPIKIAYDAVSNLGGVKDAEVDAIGVTYSMGGGTTLYAEQASTNTDWNDTDALTTAAAIADRYELLSGTTDTELSATTVGVSHAMGGVTLFLESDSVGASDGSDTDETTFGVRYAF